MNHLRLVLAATTALIGVWSVTGIQHLAVTPDNRVFFDEHDRHFREYLEFESSFQTNTSNVFVVSCAQSIFECPELAPAIRKLTELSRNLPYATRVESIATYPSMVSTPHSIESNDLLDFVCSPECDITHKQKLLSSAILGRLLNRKLTHFAVYVSHDFDVGSSTAVQSISDQSELMLDQIRLQDGLEVRRVGAIPLMQAFVDATNEELTGTMGLAVMTIMAVVLLTIGSPTLALVMLGHASITILTTLGIGGHAGLVLNTATSSIPAILFTLTIAMAMHYFIHVVRVSTLGPTNSMMEIAYGGVRAQFVPIALTSFTTTACMMSMLSVSSPPVRDIGVWTAIGVCIGTAYLFLIVPVVVGHLPGAKRSSWIDYIQPKLNDYARDLSGSNLPLILLTCLTVAAAFGTLRISLDDDFVRYFPKDSEYRADTETVSEVLTGPHHLEVLVSTGVEYGVFEQSHLNFVDQAAEYLRSKNSVDNVISLVDVLEMANKHAGTGGSLRGISPESAAQLFLVYELSLTAGATPQDLVDIRKSSSRISIAVEDLSSTQLRHLLAELEQTLKGMAPSGQAVSIVGESIPLAFLSYKAIPSMGFSLGTTFVLTAIFIGLVFRSFRVFIVAIISTLVPVILGFSSWGIVNENIGISMTVILAVCMGVVIDDSIHMLYRFDYALRKLNMEKLEAARYAVHRAGTAIITTTIVISLGFGMLFFSGFELNRQFGICSAIVMTVAVFVDLIALPRMLTLGSHRTSPVKAAQ